MYMHVHVRTCIFYTYMLYMVIITQGLHVSYTYAHIVQVVHCKKPIQTYQFHIRTGLCQ